MRPLIIGGPTAAGKSAAALRIAEAYGARIISADAMTVYRQMDVGTAKPPPEVLAVHPHDAIDIRDPDEDFTVEDFADIVMTHKAGPAPLVIVGGTPFYLAALVRPLPPLPEGDPRVRARLETLDDPYAALVARDPPMARRLHPNDRVRVIRALEVIEISGERMSTLQAAPPRRPPLDAEVVWLDREGLRERIDRRLEMMIAAGYVEETEALLNAGWSPSLKPMKSFSYRHMVEAVRGTLSLEEAIRRTARDTWRLARKQRNWAKSMGWNPQNPHTVDAAAARAFA
ncbi:MAG: tRNA (adenosine(37)-N6)-dimethylallyltransferase MiaA [Myxococcota bacterium]